MGEVITWKIEIEERWEIIYNIRKKLVNTWQNILCFLVTNGTDFADKTAGYGLGNTKRINEICDFW